MRGRVRTIMHRRLCRSCRVRGRLAVTESQRHVVRAGLVDSSGRGSIRVLINGALHLLQQLIDLNQIILRPNVRHRRQRVVLLIRSVAVRAFDGHDGGDGAWQVVAVDGSRMRGENSMKRQKPLSYLVVRVRVQLATFSLTKELIQRIVSTLAVIISRRGLVAHVITSATHRLVVHRTTKLSLGVVLIVTARMARSVGGLAEGGRVSSHLTIVIIIARWGCEAN